MPTRLRPNATYLSPEEIHDIIASRNIPNAMQVLSKNDCTTKGLIFEVDLVEMLKSVGGKVIHKGKKLKAHRGGYFGNQRSFFLVSGVPEMPRHWEFMMNRIHSNIESTVVDYSACATSL
ncbi:30217_t:CDS:2, partial [Gigaspora margarita]